MNSEQECTISNGNRKWIAYLRVQHSEHSVHIASRIWSSSSQEPGEPKCLIADHVALSLGTQNHRNEVRCGALRCGGSEYNRAPSLPLRERRERGTRVEWGGRVGSLRLRRGPVSNVAAPLLRVITWLSSDRCT